MISVSEAFAPLQAALEDAGVRYAIGGSWASTAFGEPRFTNDVDILADLTAHNLTRFLEDLPQTYYVDPEEAHKALRLGRSFNIIHISGISDAPAPFVTPEDILLAKLHWFRNGGEVSDVQWRDIQGIVRGRKDTLDRSYLQTSASKLGLAALLEKALQGT
jgi:hypothetical protein